MTRERSIRTAVAELLTPLPVAGDARQRRGWEARVRGTALEALRYTQFVGVMKRALPIAAAALVAAVIIYALVPRQADRITVTYEQMGRIDNDLAMIKPRLTGADSKGNPFTITADAAIQDRHNMRRARLRNVEADISLDQQRWINATATNGRFDMDSGALALTDGISLYSDSGYELHTAHGNIDVKKGTITGPVEVKGQGPMGAFRADRFTYSRASNMLALTGNVQMTMYVQNMRGHK